MMMFKALFSKSLEAHLHKVISTNYSMENCSLQCNVQVRHYDVVTSLETLKLKEKDHGPTAHSDSHLQGVKDF